MLEIKLIPEKEFQRIRKAEIDRYDKLSLLADMCRANALATVAQFHSPRPQGIKLNFETGVLE